MFLAVIGTEGHNAYIEILCTQSVGKIHPVGPLVIPSADTLNFLRRHAGGWFPGLRTIHLHGNREDRHPMVAQDATTFAHRPPILLHMLKHVIADQEVEGSVGKIDLRDIDVGVRVGPPLNIAANVTRLIP